jgi:hypothetical protein
MLATHEKYRGSCTTAALLSERWIVVSPDVTHRPILRLRACDVESGHQRLQRSDIAFEFVRRYPRCLACVCIAARPTRIVQRSASCGLGRPYRQSAKRLGVRPASRALDKLNDRRDVFPQHVVAVRNEKAVCHYVSPFLVSSRAARRLADDRTKRTGVVQETSVRSRSECRLSPNQISAAARRRLRLYFIPRRGGGGRRDRSALCRGEHHHDRHRSHP